MRITSIDVFRALTMFLMIFVIDAMSLSNIPDWLGHKEAHEDAMGFADVIFPAFLFIVGLAIPHAILAREKSNTSIVQIVKHILLRTLSLIIMGLFIVNLDNMNNDVSLIDRNVWQLLMGAAFLMIWNDYDREKGNNRYTILGIKSLGIGLLLLLAILYRGGSTSEPSFMQIHWWGILGLIGWSYGVCALLYLKLRNSLYSLGITVLLFFLLNIQEFIPLFGSSIKLVISASNYACVMSGVFVSVIVIKLHKQNMKQWVVVSLSVFGLLLFIFGFVTRSYWGISKIMATPSWTAICSGISVFIFVLLYWLADRLKLVSWYKPIKTAGHNTLTCYVMPYIVWAIMGLIGFHWPAIFTAGYWGIAKSLLFSFFIIYLTKSLNDYLRIRLKI